MALSLKNFNSLSIQERHIRLQNEGDFISSRRSESYFVYLFSLQHEYIELWMSIPLNQVMWIERMDNPEVLRLYTDKINLTKDLGI